MRSLETRFVLGEEGPSAPTKGGRPSERVQLANDALLQVLLYLGPRQGTEAVSFASVIIAERSEQVVTAPRGGSPPVGSFEPPPGRPLKLGL